MMDSPITSNTICSKLGSAASDAFTTNKTTAINAGVLEAGRLANKQLSRIAKKRLPIVAGAYAETPFGQLVMANMLNIALTQMRPNDEKLQILTEAMMTHAYAELFRSINLDDFIEELFADSKLSKALEGLEKA